MLFCPLTQAFLLAGASLYQLHIVKILIMGPTPFQIGGSVHHHTPFGMTSACSIAYAPDLVLAVTCR